MITLTLWRYFEQTDILTAKMEDFVELTGYATNPDAIPRYPAELSGGSPGAGENKFQFAEKFDKACGLDQVITGSQA
jgi:hypothetical protein